MVRLSAWNRMTSLVETMGEESVVEDYCSRIAEGEHPKHISVSYGVSPIVMREWMESDARRMQKWELAKRCLADHLQWDGIEEARMCDVENVALGKYRTETYMKASGIFNRKDYGNKVEIEVNQQISIIQALEEAHSRVINGVTYDQKRSSTKHIEEDRQHERHDGGGLVIAEATLSEVSQDQSG